jgi:hypothetical protein
MLQQIHATPLPKPVGAHRSSTNDFKSSNIPNMLPLPQMFRGKHAE